MTRQRKVSSLRLPRRADVPASVFFYDPASRQVIPTTAAELQTFGAQATAKADSTEEAPPDNVTPEQPTDGQT
jgi:hypothetical protein